MHPIGLTGGLRVAAGIILGFGFGFVLVKSAICWRKTVFEQFCLKNCLFIKTLFISIAIGAAVFYMFQGLHLVDFNFRPVYFWPMIAGAIITGVGLIVCGQVPATAVAALASGRVHAIWTLIGMCLAIPAVRIVSGFLSNTIYSWSTPFSFPDTLDGYISSGQAVLWLAAVAIVVSLFLEYTVDAGSGKSEKKEE